MSKKETITVQGTEITVITTKNEDFISLTDMAHSQMEEHIIIKWLSLKSTIEYIGEWETLYNPDFNYTEFGNIKSESGDNGFVLTSKQWVDRTNGAKQTPTRPAMYAIMPHLNNWLSSRTWKASTLCLSAKTFHKANASFSSTALQ